MCDEPEARANAVVSPPVSEPDVLLEEAECSAPGSLQVDPAVPSPSREHQLEAQSEGKDQGEKGGS